MTEREWLASEDPSAMLDWATRPRAGRGASGQWVRLPSSRGLRLYVVALALEYHKEWFSEVLAAHLWIDGLAGPPAPSPSRWNLYDLPAREAASEAVRYLTEAGVRPTEWMTPDQAMRGVSCGRAAAMFRDIVGNPWKPVEFRPQWRTPDVLSLVQAAYDERDPKTGALEGDRLLVLSDAMEEAGCGGDVLTALRAPGPHYRGFWALDLILGKE